jgi:hypothetical protein
MLHNATLLRIDPPSPALAGGPLSIRCALTAPTANALRWLEAAEITASAVLYLPPITGSPPNVATGDRVLIRLDGRSALEHEVVHILDRAGGAIRYTQVFLQES